MPDIELNDISAPLHAYGLIDDFSVLGDFAEEVYRPFLERLEANGCQTGANLFVVDYDWRQSIFENAAEFEEFIGQTNTKSTRVRVSYPAFC
ncbi:hypothetical protein DYI23_10200 [Roseibium polysiphoniae]|uniref:Uncharacterized protein n=1 Tax=Roseibium polysiphoniae TaxID=2571221 RepID=A0A944GSR2_9HYPH|nr:hypothetical protein [Roseibium polysiphoniae]